jgi:BolA protein
MSTIEQLKAKLTRELDATHVDIIDESWKHAGHVEATPGIDATHLSMIVVSPRFEGLGILDQHRLVHDVLKEARERHLHALQLKTLSPSQWAHYHA